MARPSAPTRNESGRPDHLINEEADKVLSKIVVRHFIAFFVLLMLMTFVMAWANIQGTPAFQYHRFLDILSVLVIMIPFFLGTNKFFKTRLQYGREYVEKKRWREAVASLEAFNHIGQRFFDPSGEAHYLLSLALAKEGRIQDADKVKNYVLRSHASSPWAERIRKSEENRPRASKAQAKPAESDAPPADKGRKVVKPKRRRL